MSMPTSRIQSSQGSTCLTCVMVQVSARSELLWHLWAFNVTLRFQNSHWHLFSYTGRCCVSSSSGSQAPQTMLWILTRNWWWESVTIRTVVAPPTWRWSALCLAVVFTWSWNKLVISVEFLRFTDFYQILSNTNTATSSRYVIDLVRFTARFITIGHHQKNRYRAELESCSDNADSMWRVPFPFGG